MIITPSEAAGALLQAGMPKNRVTEFVAIAICESGLNTDAISPAQCYGLWQILYSNFPGLGLPFSQWSNPYINALAAVRLSGHGANCAAWDTCYRDIYSTGRYGYLNWPEAGSCAAGHLGGVSVAIGSNKQQVSKPSAYPGVSDTLGAAVDTLNGARGRALPALAHQAASQAARARTMYRKGWRP